MDKNGTNYKLELTDELKVWEKVDIGRAARVSPETLYLAQDYNRAIEDGFMDEVVELFSTVYRRDGSQMATYLGAVGTGLLLAMQRVDNLSEKMRFWKLLNDFIRARGEEVR